MTVVGAGRQSKGQMGVRAGSGPIRARSDSTASGASGLTRCSSKPASLARCRSAWRRSRSAPPRGREIVQLAQPARRLVAVDAGQADVQEHQVGIERARRLERLLAVVGGARLRAMAPAARPATRAASGCRPPPARAAAASARRRQACAREGRGLTAARRAPAHPRQADGEGAALTLAPAVRATRPPCSSTSRRTSVRPMPRPPCARTLASAPARTGRIPAAACPAGCRCRCPGPPPHAALVVRHGHRMRPPGSVYLAALSAGWRTPASSRTRSPFRMTVGPGCGICSTWPRASSSGRRDFDRVVQDVAELQRLAPQLDQPAADARDVQQVVDQARELVHLARHQLQLPLAARIAGGRRAAQELDRGHAAAPAGCAARARASPGTRPCAGARAQLQVQVAGRGARACRGPRRVARARAAVRAPSPASARPIASACCCGAAARRAAGTLDARSPLPTRAPRRQHDDGSAPSGTALRVTSRDLGGRSTRAAGARSASSGAGTRASRRRRPRRSSACPARAAARPARGRAHRAAPAAPRARSARAASAAARGAAVSEGWSSRARPRSRSFRQHADHGGAVVEAAELPLGAGDLAVGVAADEARRIQHRARRRRARSRTRGPGAAAWRRSRTRSPPRAARTVQGRARPRRSPCARPAPRRPRSVFMMCTTAPSGTPAAQRIAPSSCTASGTRRR